MPRRTTTALAAVGLAACLTPLVGPSAGAVQSEEATSQAIDTVFTLRKAKVQACADYREAGVARLKTRVDARKVRGSTLATYYVDVKSSLGDTYTDQITIVPGKRTKTAKSQYVGGPEGYSVQLRVVFDNGPRKSATSALGELKAC